jgi:hypothetical protein
LIVKSIYWLWASKCYCLQLNYNTHCWSVACENKYSRSLKILDFPGIPQRVRSSQDALQQGSSSVEYRPEATGLGSLTVVSASPASALLVISTVLRIHRRQPWAKLCGQRPEWRALSSGRWPHVGVDLTTLCLLQYATVTIIICMTWCCLRKPVPICSCSGSRRGWSHTCTATDLGWHHVTRITLSSVLSYGIQIHLNKWQSVEIWFEQKEEHMNIVGAKPARQNVHNKALCYSIFSYFRNDKQSTKAKWSFFLVYIVLATLYLFHSLPASKAMKFEAAMLTFYFSPKSTQKVT